MAITQTRSRSGSRSQGSLLAPAGAAVAVASLVGLVVGLLTSTAFPRLADPSSGAPFVIGGAVLSVIHAIVLGGVAVLATTGAVRAGILKYVAFAIALTGLAGQLAGETVIRFAFDAGNTLFSIAMPLLGIGMILVGIGVLVTRRWSGWRAYVPLACGVYIPAVLVPSFAIAHGPSFPALAGFSLVYTLLGIAMRVEAARN